MFRGMRRFKQMLTEEECVQILTRGTSGVLAVMGDEGYPYAVPLSYVYEEGKIIFHSAKSGHKIDAIKQCDKASFCVIDKDHIVPEKYTTYFRSVIAFGKVHILENDNVMRVAIDRLAEKYRPGYEEEREQEIQRGMAQMCMFELEIEHMTGKEAIELTRANNSSKKE